MSHPHARLRAQLLALKGESGLGLPAIAALLIAPIVLALVAWGGVMLHRVGGDVAGVFTRDTQTVQMIERMQLQLSNATTVDVESSHAFVTKEQPSRRTAYYVTPVGGGPEHCVTSRWELAVSDRNPDTLDLINTHTTHESDSCESSVATEREWVLTGFQHDTAFTYENAYGRDLHYTDGVLDPEASTAERPEGLFNNEWDFPHPGLVTIEGTLNQPFGATPVRATATTALQQMRPGAVDSHLGELGPVMIIRTEREPDRYRFQFTARTELNDPRASIEWSWRWAYNGGTTPTDVDESAFSEWEPWTGVDHHEHVVHQGAKFQLQVRYRVVFGNELAESETFPYTWVRPVETPPAPDGPPTLTPITPTMPSQQVEIAPHLVACPTETFPRHRTDHWITLNGNVGNRQGWFVHPDAGAPEFTRTVAVRQGERVDAHQQVMCVGAFAESDWSESGPEGNAIQPITTAPNLTTPTTTTPTASTTTLRWTTQVTGCPAHLGYEARWRIHHNLTGAGWRDWTAFEPISGGTYNAAVTPNLRQGDRTRAGYGARCVSDDYDGPTAISESNATGVIIPISAQPTLTNVQARHQGSGAAGNWQVQVRGHVASCPAHLGYQWQRRADRTGSGSSWSSSWPGISAGTTPWVTVRSDLRQGDDYRGHARARCVSDHAQGPATGTVSSTLGTRPITIIPTLSSHRWTASVESGRGVGRGTVGNSVCQSHMTLQVRFMGAQGNRVGNGWDVTGAWTGTNRNTGASVYWGGRALQPGEIWATGIELRCSTTTPAATRTGPVQNHARNAGYNSGTVVRPFNVPTISPSLSQNSGSVTAHRGSVSGSCGTFGTFQWRAGSNSWTTATTQASGTVAAGSTASRTITTRCNGTWTTTNGTSYNRSVSRPVPAPSTPSSAWALRGGVTRMCNNSSWFADIVWNAASYATSYSVRSTYEDGSGQRVTAPARTTSGTEVRVNGGVTNAVVRAQSFVRASNSSGTSGERGTGTMNALPNCIE